MADSQKARVQKWMDRVRSANKMYDRWSDEFNTDRLENYYKGKQWRGLTDEEAEKKYVINLVFATIETNKPSLVFSNPQVRMSVKPAKEDDLGSAAKDRVKLCQDTVQSFIDDDDFGFVEETSLALHEAHFRFGVVEVGYTSDWIDNPNAGKPVMKEKDRDEPGLKEGEESEPQPLTDSEGQPVLQPERIVRSEKLFVKHIPADTFRVSISSKNRIGQNDWVGYYEWHLVEDLKRNPLYKVGARGLKASGVLKTELQSEQEGETEEDRLQRHGMAKVWKIWDLRTNMKKVFAEGHEKFLCDHKPFKFLPFAVLRFYPVLKSFYPLPPVSQWLSPQDEINETREGQRAHVRRFYRRYTTLRGALDDVELEKLETGGDGVIAIANQPNPLQPVQDAPMGSDPWQHLEATKYDFMQVTGVGGDQRGVAESETATQATIIAKQAQLRDSSARGKVQKWLAEIAHLMLLTIRESMALPFWIERNVELSAADDNLGSEIMRVATIWEEIRAEDLGVENVITDINLSTMSPVAQEQDRMAWNQVLGLMTNPTLIGILAISPALLKKTLQLYGITSQTEQAEIVKAIQQQQLMIVAAQVAAANAGSEVKGGKPAGSGGGGQPTPPGETPAEMQGTIQ